MINAQKAYNNIFNKNIKEIEDAPIKGGGNSSFINYLMRESPAYKLVDLLQPLHSKFNRIPIIHVVLPNNEFTNRVNSIAALSHPVSLAESSLIISTGGGNKHAKRKPPMILPIIIYDNASLNHLQHEHYKSLAWRNHLINNWIIQTKPTHYNVLRKHISNILPRFSKCHK